MKKFVYIFLFLSVVISCSESDSDSNDSKENFTVTRTIDLNVPLSSVESPFNLNSNEDISILQLNDIKNVSIDSLSYKLGFYQIGGLTDIKTGEIYINDLLIGTFSDISVNEQSGSVFPIRDISLLSDLEALLSTEPTFNIDFIGTTTSPWSPGTVRLDFYMDITVTRGN